MKNFSKELSTISDSIQKEFKKISKYFYKLEYNFKKLYELQNINIFTEENFNEVSENEINVDSNEEDTKSENSTNNIKKEEKKIISKKSNKIFFSKIVCVQCIDLEKKKRCKGYKIQFFVQHEYIYLGPFKFHKYAKNIKNEIIRNLNQFVKNNQIDSIKPFIIGLKPKLAQQKNMLKSINK